MRGAGLQPPLSAAKVNMVNSRLLRPFLLILLLLVGYGCYVLLEPFSTAVMFASVAAVLGYPLYSQIHRRVGTPSLASLLSTASIATVFAILLVVIGWTLTSGVREMYDSSRFRGDEGERLGVYVLNLLSGWTGAAQRYIPIPIPDIQSTLTGQVQQLWTVAMNSVAGLIGGIASGLLNLLICIFILFPLSRWPNNGA
jgi:predicted PurR-regulated permease PerM